MANALTRVFNRVIGKAEGQPHGPPYVLPITGGWLGSEGDQWNWWQKGYYVQPFGTHSAMVEACVSAYSQTVAMCPGDHWRQNDKGGRDRVETSALSRLLREPNDYQSISDFMLNMTRDLYLYGNAYALILRNDRYEPASLHPMRANMCWPKIAPDGSIFYTLMGNFIIQNRLEGEESLAYVPARDVLHIKLHSNQSYMFHPLVGASPLLSAALDVAVGDAIKQQQLAFFINQARPSFVLSTDLLLTKDQVTAVRDRWDNQSKGLYAGGTPILTGGLKPYPVSARNRDAQLAEILKMSDQDIALVFRIPFALLGITSSPAGATEAVMQEWVASGLGFCLNHIEEAIGQAFNLDGQPWEYVEFDTKVLLRSAFKDRIAALKEGVTGGIFSPNDARNYENLDSVPYGDEPRMQQQQVPLSAAAGIPAGPPGLGKPTIPPAPPAPPQPPAPKTPPAAGSKTDAGELAVRSLQYARQLDQRRAIL
jgi:HK97 family phage portal protein